MNCVFRAVTLLLCSVTTLSVPNILAQQSSGDMSQLVKSSIDAVVLIVVNDANGKPVAQGSGFLISSDGRIVTNHHVMDGATSAIVKLNNGAFFPVEGIIADDAEHDLAVIKVAGKGLPYLSLEDSDTLVVGQRVLAIGSPLGLENSVSDGIVSAVRHDNAGKGWIQTTAAASHGNSGGPLLVMDGKVAGVLTLKVGEGENLNFAVPSKLIAPLLTNSAVQPLGETLKSRATPIAGPKKESVWTSMTTGRDFKVRIDGDYVYSEWINLPSQLQTTPAFSRSELKKAGDKWVGKARSRLPYSYKIFGVEYVNWCSMEQDFEIDSITDSRIEGHSSNWSSFDAKKCKPGKTESKPFTWILK